MTTSSSKQPEDQPNAQIPELAESAAEPKVTTKASSWPMPNGCVNGDAKAEPHIFVGGVRVPSRKK